MRGSLPSAATRGSTITDVYNRAGDATHHGGHQPASELQRVPAHGARPRRDGAARPRPSQGRILQRIQQVSKDDIRRHGSIEKSYGYL